MPVIRSKFALAAAAAVLAVSANAFAGGAHKGSHAESGGHGPGHGRAFGEPGKSSEVSRTIEIVMGDNFFEPEKLVIQAGKTVHFVIKNEGDFLHEFNLGTAAMHAKHQKEMMAMMEHGMLSATGVNQGMMKMDHGSGGMSGHVHDDPNSVLVEPGKTQEIVWRFAAATGLEFACNVPGHYEAGMMGEIEFGKAQSAGGGAGG